MCSVLIAYRVLEDSPLGVFHVRDESLQRPGKPPWLDPELPGVLAPRDPFAGGTWFGFAPAGFLVGLVNRRDDSTPPAPRSRGQLILNLLQLKHRRAALKQLLRLWNEHTYGGCRVFLGDADGVLWLDLEVGKAASEPLPLGRGTWLMRHTAAPGPAKTPFIPLAKEPSLSWARRVHRLASQHEPGSRPLCQHGENHGSVNVTFAALTEHNHPAEFWHQQGGPCSGSLRDYSALWV